MMPRPVLSVILDTSSSQASPPSFPVLWFGTELTFSLCSPFTMTSGMPERNAADPRPVNPHTSPSSRCYGAHLLLSPHTHTPTHSPDPNPLAQGDWAGKSASRNLKRGPSISHRDTERKRDD